MSTHTINTTETPLKRGLTLKGSLEKLASELHEAVPLVEAHYGYEHDAALCLKEALGEARRMFTAIEAITRLLASSIHHQGSADREIDEGQGDLFGEEARQAEPLQLTATGTGVLSLERERTLPGGDAHDSFSQHLIEHEDPPHIKLPFKFEGEDGAVRRFVAVAMSPGQWIEAIEVLYLDEFEASGLPINLKTNQGLRVRCGDADYALGETVRFAADQAVDAEFEVVEDEEVAQEAA